MTFNQAVDKVINISHKVAMNENFEEKITTIYLSGYSSEPAFRISPSDVVKYLRTEGWKLEHTYKVLN